MAEKPEPARLQDLLAYKADTYLSPDEITLIQQVFRDERVTKVLRKAMLPSVGDPDMPVEEMGTDTWLLGRNWDQIEAAEVKPLVVARQEAIKFVMGGIIKLKQIAYSAPVSSQVAEARREKNSNK